MNKHTGSNFNDWLDDEGINQEVTAIAVKRVNGFITSTEFINSLPADEQQAIKEKSTQLKQVYRTLEQIQATPINKAELERLANMPDSEIDYTDMPQLTPQQIANFRPAKEVFRFMENLDITNHEFTGEELGALLLESVRQAKAGQGITRQPNNHA